MSIYILLTYAFATLEIAQDASLLAQRRMLARRPAAKTQKEINAADRLPSQVAAHFSNLIAT
jgi:hypothetical protein